MLLLGFCVFVNNWLFRLVECTCLGSAADTMPLLCLYCRAADSLRCVFICSFLVFFPAVSTCTIYFLAWRKGAWQPIGLPLFRISTSPCLQRYCRASEALAVWPCLLEATEFCSWVNRSWECTGESGFMDRTMVELFVSLFWSVTFVGFTSS